MHLADIWFLYDEYICKKFMGIPLPPEITDEIWEILVKWSKVVWMLGYASP